MLLELLTLIMPVSILLGVYLAIDLWWLNKFGPAFALQEVRTTPHAQYRKEHDPKLVSLRGRRSGLIGWLLTQLRLEANATFEVTEKDLRIRRESLKGFDLFYVPMHDLSSSSCGYFRAISLLLLCISYLASGFIQLQAAWIIDDAYQQQAALSTAGTSCILAALAAAGAFWLFEVSKRITISVETSGGVQKTIAFKRSIIENVTIGLSQTLEAVSVLNELILRRTVPALDLSRHMDERSQGGHTK